MRIYKTVMQMRLEAERRCQPKPKPPGKPNEKHRPKLAATTPFEPDARAQWLLYLRTGSPSAR